jgi:hypothetical protein
VPCPYLFERIEDYTELLLPDDLLSATSILTQTRAAMTPDTCKDVEVIGWLYQFYISEKKDEVFDGLKKNKEDHAGEYPGCHSAFYTTLDCALSGGKFAWTAVAAEQPIFYPHAEDGLLHRARGSRNRLPEDF